MKSVLSRCRIPSGRDVIGRMLHLTITQTFAITVSANIVADELIDIWKTRKPDIYLQPKNLIVKKIKSMHDKYFKVKKCLERTSCTAIKARQNFAADISVQFKISRKVQATARALVDWDLGTESSKQSTTECSSASNISDALPAYKMPKKKLRIAPELVKSLDNARVSNNNATSIVLSCAHFLGIDLSSMAVSTSTMFRQRKRIRTQIANEIKQTFGNSINDSLIVLHWDGKLLPKWTSTEEKKDNLAIVVSAGKITKMLGVVQLDKGK